MKVASPPEKILFYQPAFLGDLILCVPALLKLKSTYPNCRLTLVVRKGIGELCQQLGLADDVWELDKKSLTFFSRWPKLSPVGRTGQQTGQQTSYQTNQQAADHQVTHQAGQHASQQASQWDAQRADSVLKQTWDLAITPHRSQRTRFLFAALDAKQKMGFTLGSWPRFVANLFFPFTCDPVIYRRNLPEFKRVLALLFDLGVSSEFDLELEAWLSNQLKQGLPLVQKFASQCGDSFASLFLHKNNHVFIFVGSNWKSKAWPADYFLELCRKLLLQGFTPVLMGDQRDELVSDKICSSIPGVLSFIGKTSIYESFLLLQFADLVLSNDSSGQHLAALSRKPCISIFGPTTPELGFISFSAQQWIVQDKTLSCRPCNPHGPKECPLGTHACMIKLKPDLVLQQVLMVFSHTKHHLTS